jgi:alkanesulfonate monooxygenase SsuD/methylene tetrahydromethanopterin reductase-like flavin-dependent oxidoreductase (luciferase family)
MRRTDDRRDGVATHPVEFGYNPPTGQRGLERVTPQTFVRDLQQVLDVASQHFSSFWVSDHLMIGDTYRLDCWTLLTWMAARYPAQQIGTNVLANSFRHPPVLAKMAASLQALSRGRFILGYGAGWVEEEYRAYGIAYPAGRVRIAQMAEAIRVLGALWTDAPASYAGEYYTVADAWCEPRPDPVPPILIGGEGERYLLRAVAELADIWLPSTRRLDVLRGKRDVLQRHCEAVGRDGAQIRVALTLPVFLSADQAEAERKAGAALSGMNPPFAGTPAMLIERLGQYIDLGVSLFQFVFPGFPETDDMQYCAEEVVPSFR